MCRLKYYTVSHKLGWRLALVTAFLFLLLGGISFGYGIKLMEYAEKKDITPVFIAVPMLISSLAGAAVVLTKKRCAVMCYMIMTMIVAMLSIHMNYRFMVKEYYKLPLYRQNCRLAPDDPYFCHQYIGTIMLCCVAVSMVPVAVGALLSCFVARKTLSKQNCYLIWFSFSKVRPLESLRNNDKPIKLMNFKPIVGEIPDIRPANEYIPDIPDFMELAIPSASPGYSASVVMQNDRTDYDKRSIRNTYKSKSLDNLDQRVAFRHVYENSLEASSMDLLVQKDKTSAKKGKGTHPRKDVVTRSDDKFKFSEQDLAQSDELDNSKYYDRAAEEWISKMMDNLQNSRCRLYGVSDEEDLESEDEASDNNSTTKPFLSKQTDDKHINDCKGLENKEFSVSVPLLTENQNQKDQFQNCNENKDFFALKPQLLTKRTREKNGFNRKDCSLEKTNNTYNDKDNNSEHLSMQSSSSKEHIKTSTCSAPEQTISDSAEQYDNVTFTKRTRINATSSPGEDKLNEDLSKEYTKYIEDATASNRRPDTGQCEMVENYSKDATTPPGLITPMAGRSSPKGELSFQFDKPTRSNPTEHVRKNWIAFEGNEDKKKLVAGRMTSSEYSDLTSYVM